MQLDAGLRPLKGKVKDIKIFGFDIETYNNNKNFLCGSIVGDNYTKFFTDKQEMINEFASNRIFRNAYLVATNLMFDFFGLFAIEDAIKKFNIIERAGSLVLATTYIKYSKDDYNFYKKSQLNLLKYDKKIKDISKEYYKISFIDSGNHLRTTVKSLGNIIGLPKLELSVKLLGHKPKNKKDWENMKEYNIRDSTITYKFVKFLQYHYNKLGANLKCTVSSTALDLFRRKHLYSFWRQESRDKIILSYNAYYGGRTEAFKRGLFKAENYGKIKVYDVNSLYSYCLKNFNFPIPTNSYNKKKVSVNDIESFEGMCYAELKVPDINIPFLPSRTDKLRFPIGTVKGYYDFNSLRKAMSIGYEIQNTGNGLIYENVFSPFKNMIKDLWDLRQEFKKRKDHSDIVPKLCMNSFYGKLGYNYMEKELLGSAEDIIKASDDITIFPTRSKKVFRMVTGEDSKIPSYVFPILPLYVTSYARSVMYDYFKKVGNDRVLYTDTDCIFTTRNISTSNDIGGLKLENTFKELIIVKPKFYSGLTQDEKSIIKIKGFHGTIQNYNIFKKLVASGDMKLTTKHFRKLRSAIGDTDKYVNEVYELMKEIDLEDNKRIWDKNKFDMSIQNSKPILI